MAEEKEEKKVGEITHFYSNLSVGIIRLDDELKLGEMIHVKGATTDFTQKVESMQLKHEEVEVGKKGEEVGVKVTDKVRDGDEVFIVSG